MSVLYPLHKLIQDRDIKIIIASETIGQAQKWLREIRSHIESSPFLNYLYPDRKDRTKWSDSEIIVNRERISGDPSITVTGVGKSILGAGADIIICDDIVSLENSATEHQRKKLKNWFLNILSPMLEPHGKIIFVCTPWHEDDLYSELKGQSTWDCYSYPGEGDYEQGCLWPEQWPLDRLHQLKKEWGTITYSRQILLDLQRILGGLIKPEWLDWYGTLPQTRLSWKIGVDPSIGESEMSDYTGIVVTAKDEETNTVYVHDFEAGRWEAQERLSKVEEVYNVYNNSTVLIEKTSMSADFIDALKRNTSLPVKPVSPGGRDKVARLQPYLPHLETGNIVFNHQLKNSLLINQLLEFPEGSYDDLVDAFVYSVMAQLKKKKKGGVVVVDL